jgi:hypothetical protein
VAPDQLAVVIDGVEDGMLKRRWLGQEALGALIDAARRAAADR